MPVCRMKANLIVDKTGFRYKPEAGYVLAMMMYTGLFCNPNWTAGEVLAVILHEIGHNFSSVIDGTMFMLTDVVHWSNLVAYVAINLIRGDIIGATMNLAIPITHSSKFKDLINELDEFIMSYKPSEQLFIIFNAVNGLGNTVQMQLNYLLASVLGYAKVVNPAMYIRNLISGIINMALNPIGYRDERIADNFATAYGYGPELSTALLKLERLNYEDLPLNKLSQYIPPIGVFLRTGIGLGMVVSSMFDPHPNTMERCLDQTRYLRKELEHVQDRETKTLIKNQIDTIDSNLSAIMREPELLKHWDIMSYSMAYISYNLGGDFKHHVMGRNTYDSIQKTYDENIGKVKYNKPKLI